MATSPYFYKAFLATNGKPAASGWFYAYVAGSSELKGVYTDAALLQPAANPLRLDGNGICPQFYTESGAYDFKVYEYNTVTPLVRGAECYSALAIDGGDGQRDGSGTLIYRNDNSTTYKTFTSYEYFPDASGTIPIFGVNAIDVRKGFRIQAYGMCQAATTDRLIGIGIAVSYSPYNNFSIGVLAKAPGPLDQHGAWQLDAWMAPDDITADGVRLNAGAHLSVSPTSESGDILTLPFTGWPSEYLDPARPWYVRIAAQPQGAVEMNLKSVSIWNR